MNQPIEDDGFGKSIYDTVLFRFTPGQDTVSADALRGSTLVALTDDATGTNMLKWADDPASPDVVINSEAYDYTTNFEEAIKGVTLNQLMRDMVAVESKPTIMPYNSNSGPRNYQKEEVDATVRQQVEHLATLLIGMTGPVQEQVYTGGVSTSQTSIPASA